MTHSPNYFTPTPAAQNPLAISAFVVSIVGVITCGLLCPISLVMGLFAMRREPRAMATASVIISSAGILLLFAFAGLTIYTAVEAGKAATAVGKSIETEANIAMASSAIESYASLHADELPAEADGAVTIRSFPDGWGNNLRYHRVTDTHYELSSAGPDGTFGNADDLTRPFSHLPPTTEPAATSPTLPTPE